ncbi:hypothetical protein UFOVP1196_82 [uncultured Caudovirales phage]|uniref:Uncharacterized protein n=1 Tax=uncultured Caudovirales phage TaxID=2100421 RepID=A0A6J5RAC8_9CAUD|nr:hypothetical protein UFOVP1196_82 [uncultured Caudovirales phage]
MWRYKGPTVCEQEHPTSAVVKVSADVVNDATGAIFTVMLTTQMIDDAPAAIAAWLDTANAALASVGVSMTEDVMQDRVAVSLAEREQGR